MDRDFLLARQLQKEEHKALKHTNKPESTQKKSISIVDPEWENIDPTPNIYNLFQIFDKKYFWNSLGSVEVKWSPRMYSCAGICTYKGKRGGCVISLSLPLLKLRPRKDLVETLLHEMIHAYLFLTKNNRDRDGHGPEFQKHMNRINKESGTHITIYHSFHDEVRVYKTHWWRCDGVCRDQKPFYGMVKRSMNRAPGPNDFWFADHQARCGGKFIKIKEPEGFKSRNKKSKLNQDDTLGQKTIDKFLSNNKNLPIKDNVTNKIHSFSSTADKGVEQEKASKSPIVPFSGVGHVLTSSTAPADRSKSKLLQLFGNQAKRVKLNNGNPLKVIDLTATPSTSNGKKLNCPVCNEPVESTVMNEHLDLCAQLDSVFETSKFELSDDDDIVEVENFDTKCPICNASLNPDGVNEHLDICIGVNETINNSYGINDLREDHIVECPCCGHKCPMNSINEHIDACLK
ncbi:sprT-like domain-containing protein Spartan [Cimex lectularius]|uniref:Protein with SprT-like domain at the N terminus n=1 Tax=Cimex lectularius TaxID=79782 RepID=A0A8I6S901_CIMLE|nr:sprT-like domain-containing protein Spartan [Cimex lectularius]